jgi:hypothetical protein
MPNRTMHLRVPPLGKPGGGVFKTTPERLREWVENLPLANIETCIGQLDFGLSEINRVELPPHERLEVLESLTMPVMHITGALQKRYLGRRFPLGKEPLTRSNQAIGLYLAMATGYKLLVAALDSKANAGPQLVIPMQRAIRYLSESLISCYQIYSQHREGIWADVHTLYALSEKHGLQAHQEVDTTLQKPAVTTVQIAYKQISLLSLAGPYRLRQGEIRLVYNLLQHWAPFSRLHEAGNHDSTGLFTCHLSSDEPPRYLLLRERDRLDDNWRILDTSGMTAPAHAALAERRERPYPRNILPGEGTLKRLILAWGVMPERRATRRHQGAPIHLAAGISAIHRLLTAPEASGDATPLREPRVIQDRPVLEDPTLEKPTVVDTAGFAGGSAARGGGRYPDESEGWLTNPLRGAFAVDPQTAASGRPGASLIESWKMVNIGTGGYCLLWESDGVSSVQVGEPVALRSAAAGSGGGWKIGVIRWMKFTPERGLGLGVELISSAATPVSVCLCKDTLPAENGARGLLLPGNKALGLQASLLLPALQFRIGCVSVLSGGGKDERIILVRQIEDTGSFAQFHFMPAENS